MQYKYTTLPPTNVGNFVPRSWPATFCGRRTRRRTNDADLSSGNKLFHERLSWVELRQCGHVSWVTLAALICLLLLLIEERRNERAFDFPRLCSWAWKSFVCAPILNARSDANCFVHVSWVGCGRERFTPPPYYGQCRLRLRYSGRLQTTVMILDYRYEVVFWLGSDYRDYTRLPL